MAITADFLSFSTPSGTYPTINNPHLKHPNDHCFSFLNKASESTKFMDIELTGSHCFTAAQIYDSQSWSPNYYFNIKLTEGSVILSTESGPPCKVDWSNYDQKYDIHLVENLWATSTFLWCFGLKESDIRIWCTKRGKWLLHKCFLVHKSTLL